MRRSRLGDGGGREKSRIAIRNVGGVEGHGSITG